MSNVPFTVVSLHFKDTADKQTFMPCFVCSSNTGDANGELLARLCGQSPPIVPIVVSTPELWVHFLTDEAVGDLGFKATYYFSGIIHQSVALKQLNLASLKFCISSADFDFSQNVEGHKVEKQVSSLALDIPTTTPARAAVLGFSRLRWATLSL